MESILDTTIGSMKETAAGHYLSSGEKLPFLKLLNSAPAKILEPLQPYACYPNFLTLDEFWNCINNTPLSKKFVPYAKENNSFRKDIFSYAKIPEKTIFIREQDNISVHVHIPYVNDGMHSHDHFEINYVYHGSCQLLFEQQTLNLTEGTLCILSPDSSHNLMTEGDSLVVAIMVRKSTFEKVFWNLLKDQNVIASFFRSSLYADNRPNYLLFYTDNTTEQKHYAQRLFLEKHMKDIFSENNCICYLSLLFSSILRNYAESARLYDFSNSDNTVFQFNVLMQYIITNYNYVTLSDLSEKFHYSPSFFSKLIRGRLGKSFSEIVKELKLQNGKELLLNTDYSVNRIADVIGYESASYFSRAFKKAYGISPQAYRRKHLE